MFIIWLASVANVWAMQLVLTIYATVDLQLDFCSSRLYHVSAS